MPLVQLYFLLQLRVKGIKESSNSLFPDRYFEGVLISFKVNVREDFIDAAPLHALTPNNRDVLGSNLHHSRSSLDVMRRERLLESGKMKSLRESLKEEAQYNSSK